MANPATQMLKNFGKLVCVSLFFYFHYFTHFFRLYSIKSLYIVLAILLLRPLKNSSEFTRIHLNSNSSEFIRIHLKIQVNSLVYIPRVHYLTINARDSFSIS
jgi:hypothetical protein